VPRPFASAALVVGAPIRVGRGDASGALAAVQASLEKTAAEARAAVGSAPE
jgi:hypothetical protein